MVNTPDILQCDILILEWPRRWLWREPVGQEGVHTQSSRSTEHRPEETTEATEETVDGQIDSHGPQIGLRYFVALGME